MSIIKPRDKVLRAEKEPGPSGLSHHRTKRSRPESVLQTCNCSLPPLHVLGKGQISSHVVLMRPRAPVGTQTPRLMPVRKSDHSWRHVARSTSVDTSAGHMTTAWKPGATRQRCYINLELGCHLEKKEGNFLMKCVRTLNNHLPRAHCISVLCHWKDQGLQIETGWIELEKK